MLTPQKNILSSANRSTKVRAESSAVKWILIGIALLYLALFLFLPLACVFMNALNKGLGVYLAAIAEPNALAAIRLTLLTALIAVPLNMISEVTEGPWTNSLVTVHFRSATKFGQKITFMAAERFFGFGGYEPVAAEIRQAAGLPGNQSI